MSLTPGGLITSWNAAAERIYGYPAEDIIGSHVSLLSPEQCAEEEAVLRRMAAGAPVER
jgi:PAS domain S-box-containing protein